MAQATQKLDEMTVPDGGIGNFIMEDAEIEEAYGPDDNGTEEYGDEGIAQFPALTKKMAAMGREGDDVIGHLQTGELVIPLALIEQDEALKEGIFQRLRDMGVEDPERYVVGSASNSINPDTGAAEFFLKNLSKTVAKAVKSVVKVIRKVAPIILPIALSFTPLGPVFGAALGSGIGTLIQGGSIKDALKSALIAGATGAVSSGFTGTTGSFLGNVQASVADPIGRLGQTFSGAQTSLSNVFGGEAARAANAGQQTFFSNYIAPTPADLNSSIGGELVGADNDILVGADNDILVGGQGGDTFRSETSFARLNNTGAPVEVTLANGAGKTIPAGGQIPAGAAVNPAGAPTVTAYKPTSFLESILEGNFTEAFLPSGPTDAQVQLAKTTAYNDAFNAVSALPGTTSAQAAQAGLNAMNATTASSIGPGLLRAYGPMAGVGAGVAAASGFFSSPEQEQLGIAARDENGNILTGEDLVAANPSQYLVSDLGSQVLDPNTGQYVPRASTSVGPVGDLTIQAPTQYALRGSQTYLGSSTPGGSFARPYVTQAAEGGAIFPRRNGGIIPDEGIPGQDSVRAMLMPGEFVMTTDAVRGMGNGNLNNGIQNMYAVMRNLERRGRAMA